MFTPREQMIAEISRSKCVMTMLYALIIDADIDNLIGGRKSNKLGDMIRDTLQGLDHVIDLWDGVEDEGEAQEQ